MGCPHHGPARIVERIPSGTGDALPMPFQDVRLAGDGAVRGAASGARGDEDGAAPAVRDQPRGGTTGRPLPLPASGRIEEPHHDAEHALRRGRSHGGTMRGGDLISSSARLWPASRPGSPRPGPALDPPLRRPTSRPARPARPDARLLGLPAPAGASPRGNEPGNLSTILAVRSASDPGRPHRRPRVRPGPAPVGVDPPPPAWSTPGP
jgi:hypothetical protein